MGEPARIVAAQTNHPTAPAARQILDILLEKYADYGIGEFDQLPRVLQVSPFDNFGSPYEIYQLFGGAEKLLQAVDEIQKFLYE